MDAKLLLVVGCIVFISEFDFDNPADHSDPCKAARRALAAAEDVT